MALLPAFLHFNGKARTDLFPVDRELMRFAAIIILLSLELGIMVPPAFALTSTQDDMPCIGTLDVCHTAAPALASGGEMPCVNESFSCQCPIVSITTFVRSDPSFVFITILFPIEQPPRS